MLDYLKRSLVFIIAIIAIISVPIALNYLVPIENRYFTVFGTESTWFSFWSCYSGAVISGLITLFVLFRTLRQNQQNFIKQKNNSEELNREQKIFQLKLLDTQNRQRWLIEIKGKLKEDLEILDFSNIERLTNKISIVDSNSELMDNISSFERRIKGTQTGLAILYQNKFDARERTNYKKTSDNLVTQLVKILSSFSDYLLKMEEAIVETKFRVENAKDIQNVNLTELAISREKGYKDFSVKRKNIRKTVKDYKQSIELINEALQLSMIELIEFEEKQIQKDLIA